MCYAAVAAAVVAAVTDSSITNSTLLTSTVLLLPSVMQSTTTTRAQCSSSGYNYDDTTHLALSSCARHHIAGQKRHNVIMSVIVRSFTKRM